MIKKLIVDKIPEYDSGIILKKKNENFIYLCSYYDGDYMVGRIAGRVDENIYLKDIEWWIYDNELL